MSSANPSKSSSSRKRKTRTPQDPIPGDANPPPTTFRIDPTCQRLIALARLGHWHAQRTGRGLHRSVPYRWHQRGIKDRDGCIHRLPTVRLGGIAYTSEEAIAWWTTALSSKAAPEGAPGAGRG